MKKKFKKGMKWIFKRIGWVVDFVFSFLEMHFTKIVAFSIMALCCFIVNATHMIIVVLLVLCVVFGISALQFSFFIIGPYLSILFLSKMVYQTEFIPHLNGTVNCNNAYVDFNTVVASTVLDPAWWGYKRLHDDALISEYKAYVLVFLIMTLQTVIKTRQKIARIDAGLPPDIPDVMFEKTTRQDADKNLKSCIKFLINYGFYKFGVEVTLSYCVFSLSYRADVFSILYAVWIFILILPRRTTVSFLWPFFLATVFFCILWQYAMAVGLSEKTCFEYPWLKAPILTNWMFLPNYKNRPNTKKTLVDFVLLLLTERQQSVFELERRFGERYHGGSNEENYSTYQSPHFTNPTPDHTLGIKSWMDLAKFVFMTWYFRITLGFLFWNGVSNVNVLSLGYLVASFVFLWIDYDLCLWPISKIITWWNVLLIYTSMVLLAKAILEFAGCIYGDYLKKNMSFLVGLFWVHCCGANPDDDYYQSFIWDLVCFTCIIFQRRYFKSCYFVHEMEDISAIYRLQAKGAKLMDELQELRLMEFQERERKTLMKIKKNMNRIKAWQKRMQGLNYNEPRDHATAIYMGDYFMFEEMDKGSPQISSSSSEGDYDDEDFDAESKKSTKKPKEDEESEKRSELGEKTSSEDQDINQKDSKERPKKRKHNKIIKHILTQVILFLDKYSEDYRYIQFMIGIERKRQKTGTDNEAPNPQDIVRQTVSKLLGRATIAFSKFCMSKTELLCYLAIFLHTIQSPNLISLALPIMVFLWGSLTTIRPTTTFWIVLIAYTEVAVVIKAIFQNSVFPWNEEMKRPIHYESPQLFLGIHKHNQFVFSDLFLLLTLFLHRYKLKTLGLWNRTHEEETYPPEDLRVYRELLSEKSLRRIKATRSLTNEKRLLMPDTSHPTSSATVSPPYLPTALWKCTSRVTAKYGPRTKILVKEIEGPILVTHDGKRLQPTQIHISEMHDEDLEGNVVLRVYDRDMITEARALPFRLTWIQHFTPVRKFFHQIVARDWSMSSDFYTLMFIFQFLNFLIIFFGYTSFANPDDVQADDYFSITENQVPVMYLVTIILHFAVILIDRVFYLRKLILGKVILHFFLVILIHLWMFSIIPIVTESSFSHLTIRQVYYLVSCLYFLMSAYQLRVGYPMRVQGHFLSKRYGYINYYAYKSLQFLPFFNQLRTVLDYLCTHTSLTLMQWMKMESIFQVVFENKCSRRSDIYYPSVRGEECPKLTKYCLGLFCFFAMVVVIWLPFIVFAIFNSVAQPNLPDECHLEIRIENFGKIYHSIATFNDIVQFTDTQYKALQKIYKENKKIWTLMSLYDNRDVGVVKFKFDSIVPWSITPKEMEQLNKTVQDHDNPITIYILWTVQKSPGAQIVPYVKGKSKIVLHKNETAREALAEAFLGKGSKVLLNRVLPKFLRITNEGKAKAISGFLNPPSVSYRNATIALFENSSILWWRLEELTDSNDEILRKIPFYSTKRIVMYTFNEKSTPKLLLNVRKKGIIGLYLSIVFVTWTFIRRLMVRYPRIMFDDMPNPDPVLQLCKDIYLARESHEFALEEDLYAKLLFLFRSPETMVKVTRLTNVEIRIGRT